MNAAPRKSPRELTPAEIDEAHGALRLPAGMALAILRLEPDQLTQAARGLQRDALGARMAEELADGIVRASGLLRLLQDAEARLLDALTSELDAA